MLFNQGNKIINPRNWGNLVRPERIRCESDLKDTQYGKFVCEPLEHGYGLTLGNALRRVLLSSLQGAAFVSVKIAGIQHEFTTIPGVLEDVTEIILNIKQVRMAMDTDESQVLNLKVTQKGTVTAADIQTNQHVEILNPDQFICTLTENVTLEMEFDVRMGKGYVPADMHEDLSNEIGIIRLDSSFSPIRRVAYDVEPARVGQMTNYDKLILEIWTDGSVTPADALSYSAKIIKEQISVFINFNETLESELDAQNADPNEMDQNLFKSIDELEFSVRATNCLRSANIQTVGDLVQKAENEMLRTKNFGRKSLDEIKERLAEMNLGFGMKIEGFDRKYLEWKRKQHNEAQ